MRRTLSAIPNIIATATLLAIGVSAAAAAWARGDEPPVLQSETATVTAFQGLTAHDLVYSGNAGGIRILDGDTAKLIATVYSSKPVNVALAPDDKTLYLAETYWTLGNRGTREDVLSIYGGKDLNNEGEITLPGRLISDPKTHIFGLSADGHYAYVYNFQPASSVAVVDVRARKVIATVEIPGCGLVFPFGARDFASLCADGSMDAVDSGPRGRYTVHRTKRFFDIEQDPVLDESVVDRYSGLALFVTYDGVVHPVHLGHIPRFEPTWSIEEAAGLSPATTHLGQITWRPGGHVPMAYHRKSGRLFVLMHEGTPWSYEEPGTQVWVLDVRSHKLLARFDVPESAETLAVTQDAKPLLFAFSGGWLWVLDPASGAVLRAMRGPGAALVAVRGF